MALSHDAIIRRGNIGTKKEFRTPAQKKTYDMRKGGGGGTGAGNQALNDTGPTGTSTHNYRPASGFGEIPAPGVGPLSSADENITHRRDVEEAHGVTRPTKLRD